MRERRRLLLPGGLLLLALGCGGDAPKTLPRQAVPTSALTRAGTIGDAPPDAVEIALAADGRLVTASGDVDLDGLRAHLVTACGDTRWRDQDGNSRRDVVFRVHPSLPFEVVRWALDACHDPEVGAYRIHFAVRPEEGGDEGTMAVFSPKRPPAHVDDVPLRNSFWVSLRAHDAPVDAGTAFALYRETLAAAPDAAADLVVGPGVAAGDVIRAVDLLLRAGGSDVALGGGASPGMLHPRGGAASGRTEVEEYVASHPANTQGFRIRIGDRLLFGGGPPAAAPPPVPRVRGRIAGSVGETTSLQKTAIGIGGARSWHQLWRWSGDKEDLLARGGSDLTAGAVERGLRWLAAHQDVDGDGRWDCDNFMKHDPPGDACDGPGHAVHDVGVTGLALLAFLHAGYLDRDDVKGSKHARNVRAGLRYLLRSQGNDGVFGTRVAHDFMYDHAIATLAMCEAFWRTRDPLYKRPARDALRFIEGARNPSWAWRYQPRGGENDTSVTGWCLLALDSGRYAGFEVDPDAVEGARRWIDHMTDPGSGRVGYNDRGGRPGRPLGKQSLFPAERSQSMTAAGILCRIVLGEDPRTSESVRKGADLCVDCPPTWDEKDGSIDMYYWYFGTLALYRVGGESWTRWNEALKGAIVAQQRASGAGAGSWDPVGVWGEDGGRVYATAMMVLCLDVYYRKGR